MQMTEQISNRSYEVTRSEAKEMEQKKSTVTVLFTYYAYFVVYSFIGWVWETVITTIDTGVLQKRGFLDVPILPIYGFAITFIVFLFYKRGLSIPKIFLGSALITSIQEFVTSWVLEKAFHQTWWDYSHMRFQIQGRVCLIGTITFGVASVLIVELVHPIIQRTITKFFEDTRNRRLCIASLFIILCDSVLITLRLL